MYTARPPDAGDADVWKCVRYTAIYGSRSARGDSFGTVAVQIKLGASVVWGCLCKGLQHLYICCRIHKSYVFISKMQCIYYFLLYYI